MKSFFFDENSKKQSAEDSVNLKKSSKKETKHKLLKFVPSHENEFRLSKYGFKSRGNSGELLNTDEKKEIFFKQILTMFVYYSNNINSFELKEILSQFLDSNNYEEKKDYSFFCYSKNWLKEKNISIDTVLDLLRKLRETLISREPDNFTKKVYMFSIRISSILGIYQTYIPSIMFLLDSYYNNNEFLHQNELEEIVTILVLHLSHFKNQNEYAFYYYFKYLHSNNNKNNNFDNFKLLDILKSWVQKNYCIWIRLYNSESDNSKSAIMRFGLNTILNHLVACVNKSYFKLKLKELENNILPNDISCKHIIKKYNLSWKIVDDEVIIRDRNLAKK